MSQMQDDKIDIVELFQTIWEGKWVIAAISATCAFATLSVSLFMPAPNFVATTEIKSLLPNQAAMYQTFNSTKVLAIYSDEVPTLHNTISDRNRDRDRDRDRNRDRDRDRDRDSLLSAVPFVSLQERYVNILARRQAFQEGLKKFAVLERDEYNSDADYNVAVARLAAAIEILPPSTQDDNYLGGNRRHWTIRFEFNDQDKWLDVLDYTARSVNEAVRASVKDQFIKLLNAERSKKKYEIEDLETARENLIAAYKQETASRIAFLREQAAIARELGIAKYGAGAPNLVARTFDSVNNAVTGKRDVISEVQYDSPFYLRGYIAIEKELNNLNSRVTIEPFIGGLLDIDRRRDALANDRRLERAEHLFDLTPAATGKEFIASSISVNGTQFEYSSKRKLIVGLALVLGGIVGLFYVLIASAMRNSKQSHTDA